MARALPYRSPQSPPSARSLRSRTAFWGGTVPVLPFSPLCRPLPSIRLFTLRSSIAQCCANISKPPVQKQPSTFLWLLHLPFFLSPLLSEVTEGAAEPAAARGRGGAQNHPPRSMVRSSAANTFDCTARNTLHTQQARAQCQRHEASHHGC